MTTPILDALSPSDATRVLAAGTTVTLPQGWSPITERTPADKAYLILEGEVSVRRSGTEIATLGPGSIVGEAAIINHKLRSATVVAVSPLKVIHFTSQRLDELAAQIPAFGEALRATTAERLGGS